MRTLLLRTFQVSRDRARVWAHLAQPARWPSWARHIKRVEMEPPGEVTAVSTGRVVLRNLVRSSFRVTRFSAGASWLWTGRFLWLRVDYDHVLLAVAPQRTEVTFRVDVGGLGTSTLGRFFAWIYARNLDRAIPRLVEELERAP